MWGEGKGVGAMGVGNNVWRSSGGICGSGGGGGSNGGEGEWPVVMDMW